jgi:DNA-binding beta-propeller fold protein YncE
MKRFLSSLLTAAFVAVIFSSSPVNASEKSINLAVLGTYAAGIYNLGAAEIVAHDPATQRLFVVNGATSKIDVLSIANPAAPVLLFSIELAAYGRQANSVDVFGGVIAAAVEANVKTDNGKVVFFDANGNFLNAVEVGALPDMLTFTPNGQMVLVANEGEPNNDYTIDPQGSVSIVDISGGMLNATVRNAGFAAFSSASFDPSIRIFGPGASVSQDLEPEYIAVSHNSKTAWVTLQENNAVGILDLTSGEFTELVGLGFKDQNAVGNGLDASDRDAALNNGINIKNRQVFGMYQPDSIAAFKYKNDTFLITANEGDAREYTGAPGYIEEARVSSLLLDPLVFPNAAVLKNNANLGRLNVSKASGDFDGDNDYDALYTFGGRSFSIWTAGGEQIYDSGDAIEQITAQAYPLFFNAGSTNNTKDDRSDNKGPEPEGITVGKAYGRTYAFIGLERIGGVMVYDVTNPYAPEFVQYLNNRNFLAATDTAAAGDLAPEGLHFISDEDSPTGTPLLVVANETSGTTTVYEVAKVR